ncbi:MAG: hypothetical protein GXY85_10945 [Candidatus Brocadiaceae bacterium]|nr:hypothetical protein [Candidatus Brocadiaceae bacterium]
MEQVELTCPVCGGSLSVYEDERKPSGTCRRCGTHVEVSVATFSVLSARQAPSPPAPPPQPVRPRPAPRTQAPPAEAPLPRDPQAETAAADAPPDSDPTRAVPLPQGPFTVDSDEDPAADAAPEPEAPNGSLDLFDNVGPRGLVGAYIEHRRKHALPVPLWLLVAIGMLSGLGLLAFVIYRLTLPA